jgi:hypothetical protein
VCSLPYARSMLRVNGNATGLDTKQIVFDELAGVLVEEGPMPSEFLLG